MKKILLALFAVFTMQTAWSSVIISSATLTSTPATDCTNLTYSLSGTLGAANYVFSSASTTVSGSVITVNVVYNQIGIGIQIPIPFTQNVNLGMLPAGNYTVNFVGYLGGTSYNPYSTSVSIASCCATRSLFTANASAFCIGDTLRLTNTSQGSTSQVWLKNGTPVDTSANFSEIVSQPGSYTYTLVAVAACGNDTLKRSINVLANPELGNDTSLCLNGDITYTIPSGWSNILWSTSNIQRSLKVTAAGTYSVTVTAASGCKRTDSVKVAIVGPRLDLGADKMICPSGAVTLDAGKGLWKSVNWTGGTTADTLNVTLPGVYIATVTNSIGCVFNDAIAVTLDKDSILNVLGSDTVCFGESVTLSVGNTFVSYNWFDNDTNRTKTFSTIGSYSISGISTAGCTVQGVGYVGINDLPVINLGGDTVLCNGVEWKINATTPGVSNDGYRWQNSAREKTFLVTKKGTYSVMITDTNGCQASDTVVVTYKDCTADTGNGGDTTIIVERSINSGLNIYPNPSNGVVFFNTIDAKESFVLQLVNSAGKLVFEKEIDSQEGELSLPNNIEDGLYFYSISSSSGSFQKGKLILLR